MGLTFWRYYLPNNENREGWADVVMRSDGWFGAVSDFGNYAFRWTHFGEEDFRSFVLGLENDYVCSKLGSQVFDADKAIRGYKDRLWRRRLNKQVKDKHDARMAWDELESVSNELDLHQWMEDYGYAALGDDYMDVYTQDFPWDLRNFVQKIMPRLKEAIRKELSDAPHQEPI